MAAHPTAVAFDGEDVVGEEAVPTSHELGGETGLAAAGIRGEGEHAVGALDGAGVQCVHPVRLAGLQEHGVQ